MKLFSCLNSRVSCISLRAWFIDCSDFVMLSLKTLPSHSDSLCLHLDLLCCLEQLSICIFDSSTVNFLSRISKMLNKGGFFFTATKLIAFCLERKSVQVTIFLGASTQFEQKQDFEGKYHKIWAITKSCPLHSKWHVKYQKWKRTE